MIPHIIKVLIIFMLKAGCQATSRKLIVFSSCFVFLTSSLVFGEGYNVRSPVILQYHLHGFSDFDYNRGVEGLIDAFESRQGKKLTPGAKKVGLKVYTASGAGLSTPLPLVRAVIKALNKRGFTKSDLFIIDESEVRLREAGFIPPLSKGGSDVFDGVSVYALDKDKYWNPKWFYTSPLPSREVSATTGDDRKSFLPIPLMLDADFWINLPMVTSHRATGVSGVLANGTLFNVGNNDRFLQNTAHASVAMAEIGAVPELKETWFLNILTLERYQYIGGCVFNANYTISEPLLWLSTDPIAMDYLLYKRINQARASVKLPLIDKEPKFFDYAAELDLGSINNIKLIDVK